MRVKLLVDNPRLSEIVGVLVFLLALGLFLCLVSYSPADPSANVATDRARAQNWMGLPGAFSADLILQSLGLVGFLLPAWLAFAGWNRIRNEAAEHMLRRATGGILLVVVACCALELASPVAGALLPARWDATVRAGGVLGTVLTGESTAVLNIGGTILLLLACTAVGLYMVTSLRMRDMTGRAPDAGTAGDSPDPEEASEREGSENGEARPTPPAPARPEAARSLPATAAGKPGGGAARQPGSDGASGDPPIVPYREARDETLGASARQGSRASRGARGETRLSPETKVQKKRYQLPSAALLNPPRAGEPYDEAQLQETAQQIVGKFEEFGVGGSVNQINPGPVVTTFEFKPNRGIKVSKVVNLSEDLCLALECESVLVERIPGKATVGIEVPNRKREVIFLREVIESPAFRQAESLLTFALGKNANGRIECTDLAAMPHLLVAGQTGSGKSVMVNCVIMSILLRATPEDVRLILVDPKTVELGLYRDIPHLLTPVITDMKLATNALKNATREMDRRLQLLAEVGARNIGQYNEKIDRAGPGPARDGVSDAGSERLPYIVIIVDELADLMMVAGRQVEESIQRLAQMARAVGIHLLLATQRPSVDVITGLIKANIPARLSFLLATRVDSRTILDSMGAESLLGKGDMLFLPPGSGRRHRLHGPLVSEDEIQALVTHWKEQASPEYENGYLESEDADEEGPEDDDAGFDDPMYRDAVQLVISLGKASTSTLQRRLRLGYGRAARILDAMERDGIIGPPDGSRPREVLKRPDWLDEVSSEEA